MATLPRRVATLHACGHWVISVPASDSHPAGTWKLDSECVDTEHNGVFINDHVFSDDPCPKHECSELVRDSSSNGNDDMEWAFSYEWPLIHLRPNEIARRFVTAVLIECDQSWDKVHNASWAERKYLAAALHSFDAYTSEVIDSGDLADNVLARYALRALTWFGRAEQFWYEGQYSFYDSCIEIAEEHVNNQRGLLREFVAALEETVDWRDNHWNPLVQTWLEGLSINENGDWKGVNDDYDTDPTSEDDDTDPFVYVPCGDGGFLDEQFQFHRDQDEFDCASYAPSSVSDDFDNDELASEQSVSVSEILNLYNDQDIYGPPYCKHVGRLEPIKLDDDAQDLIDKFITDYVPEVNTFEELCEFQENVLPEDDDDDSRCELQSGNGRLTNATFNFGKNFKAVFGTNSIDNYHFTFRIASRKW